MIGFDCHYCGQFIRCAPFRDDMSYNEVMGTLVALSLMLCPYKPGGKRKKKGAKNRKYAHPTIETDLKEARKMLIGLEDITMLNWKLGCQEFFETPAGV